MLQINDERLFITLEPTSDGGFIDLLAILEEKSVDLFLQKASFYELTSFIERILKKGK